MRSVILLYLYFTGVLAVAQNGYTLSGKIENAEPASVAYLYYPGPNNYVVDSCRLQNGRFNFSGSVGYPVPATLDVRRGNDNNANNAINFYIENAPIFITMDWSKGTTAISGSHTHDLHMEFIEQLQPVREEMNSIHAAYSQAVSEQQIVSRAFNDSLMKRQQNVHRMNMEYVFRFVKAHPDDFISLYLLRSLLDNVPDEEQVVTVFPILSEEIKESSLGKSFAVQLQKVKATSLGSAAPEFECKDINGNIVHLSDFRGKYLLLIFWASDCSHCLEELPNVIKTFNLLAGEDFSVVSVAVDPPDREKQWEDFVKTNRLPWINLFDERIDGKKKISGLYNIHKTPSNFLLNKKGQIIAKDLYGEELLLRLTIILQLSSTLLK